MDVLVEKLRTLPTPVVGAPLHESERRVTSGNVVHGATVTLLRSAGPNLQGCFDLDRLWMGPRGRPSGNTITNRLAWAAGG